MTSRANNPPVLVRDARAHYIASPPVVDDFRLLSETPRFLSIKTQNALLRAGYCTTQQLLDSSSDQLLRISNFGPAAYHEVCLWREAVLHPSPDSYADLHRRISRTLEDHCCPHAAVVASGVLRVLRDALLEGPPIDRHNLHQLLTPPPIEA